MGPAVDLSVIRLAAAVMSPPQHPSSTSTLSLAAGPRSSNAQLAATASSRLGQLSNHISMGSNTTFQPSSFTVDAVPKAPEDPLFGLMAAYRADTFEKKVDLGIGAYRDDNAKPWVLPVVKKVWICVQRPIEAARA